MVASLVLALSADEFSQVEQVVLHSRPFQIEVGTLTTASLTMDADAS